MTEDRTLFRTVIDALVLQCRDGRGQISARRVQAGVWNENAEVVQDAPPDQHAMNLILTTLTSEQRDALALLFAEEFQSGVYNTLEVLEAARIHPFVGQDAAGGEGGGTASGTASDPGSSAGSDAVSAPDYFLDLLDEWE